MGDDIQAIKAGILEIADILVINKADHPGVESTERALRVNLELGYPNGGALASFTKAGHTSMNTLQQVEEQSVWVPPVLKTVAIESKGIAELVEAIAAHHAFLKESGLLAKRDQERLEHEFEALLGERLKEKWRGQMSHHLLEQTLEEMFQRQISPWQAADRLVNG
jgi:LAO/AO transport system kinase